MPAEWLYTIDLEHVPNDYPHSARKMRGLAGGAKQIENLSYNAKDFEEDWKYLTSEGEDYSNEFDSIADRLEADPEDEDALTDAEQTIKEFYDFCDKFRIWVKS